MLRWFVTGAGGQLATAFERLLEGEVFLSREAALDIRDADAVRAAVRAFEPDVVLHTAAYTDVDGAEADEQACWAVNVEGTRNVVQAVRGTHTSRSCTSRPTTSSTATGTAVRRERPDGAAQRLRPQQARRRGDRPRAGCAAW